jgi:hypothetical protein
MKTWKPDTCGCCIEEIYEGTEIKGGGVVLTKCPAHAAVPDDELYGVLYANDDGENKRKNRLHAMLLGVHGPALSLNLTEPGPDGRPRFKDGVEYEWSFTGEGKNRVLNVSVRGAVFTGQQRAALHNECETQFGSGKVQVA